MNKKIDLILLLAIIILGCLKVQAAEQDRSQFAFARGMRDIAVLDLGLIDSNENWAIAKVIPKPLRREIGRNPFVPWDGKTPRPDNTQVTLINEGTVEVVTPLKTPPLKNTWPYHYEKYGCTYGPQGMMIMVPPLDTEGHEEFSPFFHEPGGYILCVVPDKSKTPNTSILDYKRAYYLPNTAIIWVTLALEYYRNHRQEFKSENVRDNARKLVTLLDDKNPFLCAAAFRTLMQTGVLDDAFVTERIMKADAWHQALYTYLLLYYAPLEKGKALTEKIKTSISTVTGPDQIEGLTFGASTAYGTFQKLRDRPSYNNHGQPLYQSPVPPSLESSKDLMRSLLEKLKSLGIRSEKEQDMFFLLTRYPMAAPEYTRSVDKGDHIEITRLGP